MNARHVLFALIASTAFSTPVAQAATGAYDGEYALEYQRLDLTVHCGYVDGSGPLPAQSLSQTLYISDGESLEQGSFDSLLEAQQAAIVALEMPARRERRALKAVELYYQGLEQAINNLIVSMPETLSIAAEGAVMPNQPAYAFLGELSDAAHGVSVEVPGTVNRTEQSFSLIPLYLIQGAAEVPNLYSVSGTAQMKGSFATSEGALRWELEALMIDPTSQGVWGCDASGAAQLTLLP